MTSTMARIVHHTYVCGDCEGKDVRLYHFGRNDGQAVSIAHGCEHYIRDSYPGAAIPDEWLSERVVYPGPDCERPPGGPFVVHGLSVGHGCRDCFELRIEPIAVHTAGASYELVAVIEAGHGADEDSPGRSRVDVMVEDLPRVIAELQRIYDAAKDATAIPSGWPIHH
jgi:hypothetical protein